MKLSKKYIALFSFFLITIFSFSQAVTNSGLTFTETASLYKHSNDLSNIKGSPYVNEVFSPATIEPLNKVFLVRYNAVNDAIEVSLEDGKVLSLSKTAENYVITFQRDNKKYLVLDNNGDSGYYVLINEFENLLLYKKEKKKYNPKQAANSSYQNEKPAYFSDLKTTYYIKFKNANNNLIEFSNSKSSLYKLFPNQKNDIKSYLKKEKIDLNDDKDLSKVIKYVNSLM